MNKWLKKSRKLIQNKLLAQQFGLEQQKQKQRKRIRKIENKIPQKPFPVRKIKYKNTAQGINVGSPIYETSSMQYGQLNPTKFELIENFYPRDAKFTQEFLGHTYKFVGLITSVAFEKQINNWMKVIIQSNKQLLIHLGNIKEFLNFIRFHQMFIEPSECFLNFRKSNCFMRYYLVINW
ncbi:unnamed protein product (macronuclear) [Paramecium tetraurelia]|uniref:Uncharacterized protein n=1 Tax=Paramecium tetraurelia TaxID=5888 RepID=A0DF20_PARTE|nr:uncharacterized protein GSPATT00016463001 [Paramecium tetraurelia]CAK81637.1 unnamed protein product [Paramecium tetraurelia]|eukprot:XP_001449034.1 hypothetical protein (macronuclear) [Paramecium tetraurelia strain d4-2]